MAIAQRQNKTDQQQKNRLSRPPQAKTNLPGPALPPPELQAALTNPQSARSETILRLQQVVGNWATQHLLQRKLIVGPAHERYEQEADGMAQQVLTMPALAALDQPFQGRQEEKLRAKPLTLSINRLQHSSSVQRKLMHPDDPLVATLDELKESKKFQPLYELIQEYNNLSDDAYNARLSQLAKIRKKVGSWVKSHSKYLSKEPTTEERRKYEAFLYYDRAAIAEENEVEELIQEQGGKFRRPEEFLGSAKTKKETKKLGKELKHHYQERYLDKTQQNRLLSTSEIIELEQIGETDDGQELLNKDIKTGTCDDAIEYINKKNYNDWLTLHPSKRLLITSIVWLCVEEEQDLVDPDEDYLKITPAYQMALSLSGRKDEVRQYTMEMWQKTLEKGMNLTDEDKETLINNAKARNQVIREGGRKKGEELDMDTALEQHKESMQVLKRIFLLMQAGLLEAKKARTEDSEPEYDTWSENVATALSHGGRVNIRIPKLTRDDEDAYAITNWLGVTTEGEINQEAGVFKRAGATHYMEVSEGGKFEEKGGSTAGFKNWLGTTQTELYGLNIAIGGIGEKDFNGDYILPDGTHGHLFIGYKPPTLTLAGALEIGCETTAYEGQSNVGYHHTLRSNESTANPLSSVGGTKDYKHGKGSLDWNRIEAGELDLPLLNTLGNWVEQLKGLEQLYDKAVEEGRISVSDLVGKRNFEITEE